jgi:hypothetical protein
MKISFKGGLDKVRAMIWTSVDPSSLTKGLGANRERNHIFNPYIIIEVSRSLVSCKQVSLRILMLGLVTYGESEYKAFWGLPIFEV